MFKLTERFVFIAHVIIWVAAALPFFIPAMNTTKPYILGLPFCTFWMLLMVIIQLIVSTIASKYAFDPFDNHLDTEDKEDN